MNLVHQSDVIFATWSTYNATGKTLMFTDGGTADFAYTVDGIAQAKSITREVFRAPGTACH